MAVGATRTGGINARAKSLGRVQSGLEGFRAGLTHIDGERDPLHRCPQRGGLSAGGDPASGGAHRAQLFRFWRLLTGGSNSPTQLRGG